MTSIFADTAITFQLQGLFKPCKVRINKINVSGFVILNLALTYTEETMQSPSLKWFTVCNFENAVSLSVYMFAHCSLCSIHLCTML